MHTQRFLSRLSSLVIIGSALLATPWALSAEATAGAAATSTAPIAPAATPALIQQGQSLFLGNARFSAGGPSCNACHNVSINSIVSGGSLAKDLTKVFDRLGAEGITGMLPRKDEPSPFPVMQAAFQGRELASAESVALVAFLQDVNAKVATQPANDFGPKMALAGAAGIVFLLLLFALLGKGRKRRSVNQELFERQLKTD